MIYTVLVLILHVVLNDKLIRIPFYKSNENKDTRF